METSPTLRPFQDLFEHGALLYLLPVEIDLSKDGAYEKWKQTLKSLVQCPSHKEMKRTCFCFEQTCPKKGLICSECLVDFHRDHAQKVFKIQEIAKCVEKHQKAFRENYNDNGKTLKKTLDDHPLQGLIENFSSNLKNQYKEFLEKIQKKNAQKVDLIFENGYLKNGEQVLSQRLDLFSSLVVYDENSSFQGMMKLQESKAKLLQKLDFLKEYLAKEMEMFEDKMKAAINVTLNLKTDIGLEKYQENIEKEKEQTIQPGQISSLSMQQNIIKRLPHLPSRTESYWPVKSDKKERIKFRPLRDRVQLLGFTQGKIVHFDNQVAKFLIKLYESQIEPQDQDLKIARITSSKEKKEEKEIFTQLIQIKPEENEESNFIHFDLPAPLKEGHEYVLELTAVEGFGCTCKYGLNNGGDLQCRSDDDVLQFLPVYNEFDFLRLKYEEFVTNETQGLFPSLIYDITLKNSAPLKFDFPLC